MKKRSLLNSFVTVMIACGIAVTPFVLAGLVGGFVYVVHYFFPMYAAIVIIVLTVIVGLILVDYFFEL